MPATPRTAPRLSSRILAATLLLTAACHAGTNPNPNANANTRAQPQPTPRRTIDVRSPKDFMVLQRTAQNQAMLDLLGAVPPESTRVEIVFVRTNAGRVQRVARQRLTVLHPSPFEATYAGTITLPAGGWYRAEVRAFGPRSSDPLASARVDRVGVGEVFLVAGQSNSANHGSERQHPDTGLVAAFDGERWRLAEDPQPGASGSAGSFVPAFGDALATRLRVPIGVISLGVGATSVREWLPRGDRMTNQPTTGANVRPVGPRTWEATGELFARLAGRLTALGPRGCRAVLWHQGESDAGQARSGYPADRQISGQQYVAFMGRLIVASREAAGWPVPWMTAQATYHSETDAADEEFREAQAEIWRRGLARRGPDTDAFRAGDRDGVHFNARGLRRHGEAWAERVGDWIESLPVRESRRRADR